jgi:uncharacterized membrane-anchored protein
MPFKNVPAIGPRYWTSIVAASLCGANIGDSASDGLGLSNAAGFAVFAVAFATIVSINQRSRSGHESLFWIAIIIVRAAATNIADLAIGHFHLSYLTTAAGLTGLLMVVLAIVSASSAETVDRVSRSGFGYWTAMLIAGTLGTVLGDGIGHAISPVTVGVPISACVAAVTVALAFAYRAINGITAAETPSYWAAIVAIRALGTNLADIAAYLLSLPLSIVLSGVVLTGILTAWQNPRPWTAEQYGRSDHSDRRRPNRVSPLSNP